MAANITTTVYLGADGLYEKALPEVRLSPDVSPDQGHVSIDFGRLTICAFGSDGIDQLRELAAALNMAADRYALARVQTEVAA